MRPNLPIPVRNSLAVADLLIRGWMVLSELVVYLADNKIFSQFRFHVRKMLLDKFWQARVPDEQRR